MSSQPFDLTTYDNCIIVTINYDSSLGDEKAPFQFSSKWPRYLSEKFIDNKISGFVLDLLSIYTEKSFFRRRGVISRLI